jgi:HD superfamily phosphodiesterase
MNAIQIRETDIGQVLTAAKGRLAIDLKGIHGIRHWTRVRENGHRLARQTGADKVVIELFAFLHDCCRESDRFDPGHGEWAAEFAESLRGTLIRLSDESFALLYEAIRGHEKGLRKPVSLPLETLRQGDDTLRMILMFPPGTCGALSHCTNPSGRPCSPGEAR